MLIFIANYNEESAYSNKCIHSITNILRLFSEGKHIVIADKDFFKKISEDERGFYSFFSRNAACEALRSQIEYVPLLQVVSFYITVDFLIDGESYYWTKKGNKDVLVVGNEYFHDSSRLQCTNVIYENVKDSDFYNLISRHYAKKVKATKCSLATNPINGGGGATKDVFDRTVQNKTPVLCVLDNDKKHPSGPAGSTCRAFGQTFHSHTGMVKVLEVHEVESLIPIETLKNLSNLSNEKTETINFLSKLTLKDESSKFYFDHKKGLNIKKAIELDDKYGDYWLPLIKSLPDYSRHECVNERTCACQAPCVSFEGLGDNILDRVVDFISRNNMKAYAPSLTPKLEQHWETIGNLLFSWSCGPFKKSRVT
ncbi:hypothetical protein ACI0YT_004248 [Cronobacter dublinensis]|nr:hypothetical protein [Cronobacter dublinensis]